MKRYRIYLSLLLTGLVLALQVALTQGSLSARVPVPPCGEVANMYCAAFGEGCGQGGERVCPPSPCQSCSKETNKCYYVEQDCYGPYLADD